jgi:hypothetical protein
LIERSGVAVGTRPVIEQCNGAPEQGDVIDLDDSLGQQFFEVAV